MAQDVKNMLSMQFANHASLLIKDIKQSVFDLRHSFDHMGNLIIQHLEEYIDYEA